MALSQGESRNNVAIRPGVAISADRTHKRRVNRELCAVPQRQAVCDHFYLALVRHWEVEIHVRQENVVSHPGASFAANPRNSPFKRDPPRFENTRVGACRPMVPVRVHGPMASAP